MKTLVLTNAEVKWLLKIVGKTRMDDGFYAIYEKLMELKEPETNNTRISSEEKKP